MRAAKGLFVYNKTNFHYLPQNIAFDDFKSGKFSTSGMSLILIDSVNHRILDVIKDCGAGQLHAYLTDKEVIDRLLALSDELRDAYAFYQRILYAIKTRDEAKLKSVLYPTQNDAQYRSLPKAMKKVQTIKSKPLSARHTGSVVSKTFVYVFSSHSRIVSTQ